MKAAQWFDVLLYNYVRECVRRVNGRVINHKHVDIGAVADVERWRPRTGFSTAGRDPWLSGPPPPTARATRDIVKAQPVRWFDVLIYNYVRERVRRVDGRVINHQQVDLGAWADVERWRPRTGFATPGRDPWRGP